MLKCFHVSAEKNKGDILMNYNIITDYVNEPAQESVFYCRATLKKDYYFINGDEFFYRFISTNSCYSLLELLHPDDLQGFKKGLAKLNEGTQYLIARFKAGNGKYYCLYFVLTESDKVLDGFRLIDVEFCDFVNMRDRYNQYVTNIKKYRMFMSMVPQFFYEYTYKTDVLEMYQYVNQKSIIFFREKMQDYLSTIMEDKDLTQDERIAFFNFYENLKSDVERFDMTVPAKTMSRQNPEGYYWFKGSSLYRFGVKEKNVGIIEPAGMIKKEEKYYMTDNAFDPGTGIFNKRAINEYAIEKIEECAVKNKSMYLAVMDIDDFKKINDTYGHMFGDEVLAKLAETIRGVLDYRGFCGRFGGDEFMIVFDRVNQEDYLREIIKTINKNLSFAFCGDERKINVTTSWGVSKFPDNGQTLEELFEIADRSLYIAKKKGKNRYIIFDEKKHGDFSQEKAETRKSGFQVMASVAEKATVMSQLILKLHHSGADDMQYVMETMRDYFDLDGIAIYGGEDMQRLYAVGNYVEPIQNLACMLKENYLDLFDDNGFYMENVIPKLKNLYPMAYQLYEKQEIGKVIQFLIDRNGKPDVIVSFDYFNRSPKVGETDLGLLTMVGRLMAQIVSDQMK